MQEVKINDYKNQIEVFDLLVVKDTINLKPPEIMKVLEVTRDYFITRNCRFSRTTFLCAEKRKENLKVTSVIVNLKRRLCEKLIKLGYNLVTNSSKSTAHFTTNKGTYIEIQLLDMEGGGVFIRLKANSISLFAGEVETLDEFKTIIKTTLKKPFGHELL